MRFFLLDPLRGLAALWVFTFHFHFTDRFQEAWPHLHTFFKQGDLGVPMFFVISGYCITASAKSSIRRNEKTADFLYRRVRRIYPPFWFSIAVVIAIPFLIESFSSLKTGAYVAPTSAGNLNHGLVDCGLFEWVRLVTLTQVFWPAEGATSLQSKFTMINAVYWTLAIEVQFYCVVGAALTLSRTKFYSLLLILTAVCAPFAMLGLLVVSGLFVPFWPMFAMGSCLFFVLERGWSFASDGHKLPRVISVTLSCLGLVIFSVAASTGFEPSWNCFATSFAVGLWLLKPVDKWFQNLSSHKYWKLCVKPFVMLGAMSYSLYLLHGKLQFVTAQFSRQLFEVDSIVYDVSVIVGTCVLCWPFYVYCETPFVKGKVPTVAPGPTEEKYGHQLIDFEKTGALAPSSTRTMPPTDLAT